MQKKPLLSGSLHQRGIISGVVQYEWAGVEAASLKQGGGHIPEDLVMTNIDPEQVVAVTCEVIVTSLTDWELHLLTRPLLKLDGKPYTHVSPLTELFHDPPYRKVMKLEEQGEEERALLVFLVPRGDWEQAELLELDPGPVYDHTFQEIGEEMPNLRWRKGEER